MEPPTDLVDVVATVPAGPWAVGVSGGADSVALLSLLRGRRDLALHVVHLDHQTRGEASAGDAEFVRELAEKWGLPCTVARWRDVEALVRPHASNPSARFRLGRLALYRRVVEANALAGVVLAHHADDQAETVFLRLLRGSGPMGLGGMAHRSVLGGLVVRRPLLNTPRAVLREWLRCKGQAWREDESNASDKYLRNRVRRVLSLRPDLVAPLLELSAASRGLVDWVKQNAPPARGAEIDVATVRGLPALLARETARQWLANRGVPPAALASEVLDRLVQMATDAASPARQHFPGGVLVSRRGGRLLVVPC